MIGVIGSYLKRILISLSVLINVILGGDNNQTFSARNHEWKRQGLPNVTYLIDVLNNTNSDQANFSFADANSSCLITIPNNPNYKYVVMPMRI